MKRVLRMTDAQVERAQEIWREYQDQHDMSALTGKAVGIDPDSGGVFFGETASAIMHSRQQAEGVWKPLYFVRVGSDSYLHKYGRR